MRYPKPERQGEEDPCACLGRVRQMIAPGHLFAVDDDVTGRTSAGKRLRPSVLVVVPTLHQRPELALQQRVGVCTRVSWKPEWGSPPSSVTERSALLKRGWVFSSASECQYFSKDGVFEIFQRRPVLVGDLILCPSLGWLPPETCKIITAHAGVALPSRYPPDGDS